jgi:hypothetical protein
MDVSDMVDVLHFFFEEDMMHISTAEQEEAITNMRKSLYEMYGRTYSYGVKKQGSSSGSRAYITEDYDSPNDIPFDPANQDTKPFVEAPDFNPDSSMPFGSILDAPIG